MNRRWYGLLCSPAAAMLMASLARAGVWGTQPVIGVLGDYNSDPALLALPGTAESHADLLLDAPTSYVADAYKLTVLPSFRVSDAQGYSSLDSDYEHLSVSNEFDSPRGSLIATASVMRDSSLYHDYQLDGSVGVRRDSVLGDVNWDRRLTQRLEFDTDANWTRVLYAETEGPATLTDYKYASVTPQLTWLQSERDKLTVNASGGRYDSLGGETQSTSVNLQAGFVRQLTEIWTLSVSGGYSRANNRASLTEYGVELTPLGYVIVAIPVALKSSQNGSVYNATLTRTTELLSVSAIASRQLTPSGFAFLSEQDTYQLHVGYTPSPLWTLAADARRTSYEQPQGNGSAASTRYNFTFFDFSAARRLTERWTATLTLTRVAEHYYAVPSINVASSGVSLEFSRQFDWRSFQ